MSRAEIMAVRAPTLDPDELHELYKDVVRVARRIVGNDAAEDVAQETFLRLLAVQEHRPRTWLATVARNLAIDEIRRRRRHATPVDDVPDEPVDGPDVAELLSVRRALKDLPERDRLLLWLKHVEGRTAGEIAQMTGVTRSSVEMRIFRARRALADSYTQRAGLMTSILAPLVTARRWLTRSLANPAVGLKASLALVAAIGVGAAVGVSSLPFTTNHSSAGTASGAPALSAGRSVKQSARAAAVPVPSAGSASRQAGSAITPIKGAIDAVIVRADTIVVGVVLGAFTDDSQTNYDFRVRRVWYGATEPGDSVAFSLPGRPDIVRGANVVLFLSDTDPQTPLTALVVRRDGALFDADGRPLYMTLSSLQERTHTLKGDRSSSGHARESSRSSTDDPVWVGPMKWKTQSKAWLRSRLG
jgi:RNA polymerase sigma-70 factor (ECF subfamily)